MDRSNAFTIEVTDWSNSDFWQLLSEITGENCLFDQPEFKSDGIFWFDEVPKELFKYADCFNWLSGSCRLWLNDKLLTRFNYRTAVYVGEGEDTVLADYDYVPFNSIVDIPPIVNEELIY
jgi:hypothetical protein